MKDNKPYLELDEVAVAQHGVDMKGPAGKTKKAVDPADRQLVKYDNYSAYVPRRRPYGEIKTCFPFRKAFEWLATSRLLCNCNYIITSFPFCIFSPASRFRLQIVATEMIVATERRSGYCICMYPSLLHYYISHHLLITRSHLGSLPGGPPSLCTEGRRDWILSN